MDLYTDPQPVEGSSQGFANFPELLAHCMGSAEQPAAVLERYRSADPGIQRPQAPRKGRRAQGHGKVTDSISTVAMYAYHFDIKINMKW